MVNQLGTSHDTKEMLERLYVNDFLWICNIIKILFVLSVHVVALLFTCQWY